MADDILKRDENRVAVLGAITNDSNQFVKMLRIDPATGRLIVSAVVAGTNNGQLKVSAADTTYGYLEDKLVAGSNITLTVINVGGNEQIQIDATGGGGGAFTSITGTPTEVAYFDGAGNGTSDSLFTRDATTKETNILFTNTHGELGFINTLSLGGGGPPFSGVFSERTTPGFIAVNGLLDIGENTPFIGVVDPMSQFGSNGKWDEENINFNVSNADSTSEVVARVNNGGSTGVKIIHTDNSLGGTGETGFRAYQNGLQIWNQDTRLNWVVGDGTAGQGILTDGSGNLVWGSPTFTGTANRFALFDGSGASTTDELATRDNTTGETTINTTFDEYTGGFFTGQPFGPGIGFYGLRAFRSDDTSSGTVALISADSGGGDLPDGVSEYKTFDNQFGIFSQLTGGAGYGSGFDSFVTGNQAQESLNQDGYVRNYSNTDFTENSYFRQAPEQSVLAWANGPLSNPTQERIVIQSAYTADNSGSVSQQMDGYGDVVKSAVGQSISTPDFTGTGLNDIAVTGTYTSSGDTVFTVTVIGNNVTRLNFNGGMDTDETFNPGEVVTGSDSGATGEVAVSGNSQVYVINTTGTFNTNDILTGDDGNISTVLTSVSGVAEDVVQAVSVNQFGTQSRYRGISTTPAIANDGISLAWGSDTVGDHDVGDEWEFTVSRLYAERTIVPAKEFPIVNNLSVDIFTLDLPVGGMASGFVEWSVNATDATDYQVRTVRQAWTAVNAGGTITVDIGAATGGVTVTSGTLASGLAYNTGANEVTFNIDAVSSLTDPDIHAFVQITNNSKQNITVLY